MCGLSWVRAAGKLDLRTPEAVLKGGVSGPTVVEGLKRLHEDDDPRGVIAEHSDKLRDILARLDLMLQKPLRYGCARFRVAFAQRPIEGVSCGHREG